VPAGRLPQFALVWSVFVPGLEFSDASAGKVQVLQRIGSAATQPSLNSGLRNFRNSAHDQLVLSRYISTGDGLSDSCSVKGRWHTVSELDLTSW
jgi:hypothetical protein